MRDNAKKYYLNEDKNCAEAIFLAGSHAYNLGLNEEDAKLVTALGGGMGCGSTCGALTGALSIFGKAYADIPQGTNDDLKVKCGALVADFEKQLGSTSCEKLQEIYRTEETRCSEVVQQAASILEKHMNALTGKNSDVTAMTVTPEDIKRVKAFGFLHCKGTDKFNCRVITRNGMITNEESQCITEAASKFGDGRIAMTTRLTMELQNIPYHNIEPIRAYLATVGLQTGGTGSKVRPVVACKGTTCQYGLYDTDSFSRRIHDVFFDGYASVKLPHKFKIALGGCPNNCVKPDLNDFGIIGQRVPAFEEDLCKGCKSCAIEKACPIGASKLADSKLHIDEDACNHCGRCVGKCPFKAIEGSTYGYKVCIGGRWGKKTAHGQEIRKIFTSEDEVMAVLEKSILLFREQGITGERFADTIARIGFDEVEKQLLSDDLLTRKTEILGTEMHLVGGATC